MKLQKSQGIKVRLMCVTLDLSASAYLTNYAVETNARTFLSVLVNVAVGILTVVIGSKVICPVMPWR